MYFPVHGELSCLSEGFSASVMGALKGFLSSMDVGVFLQILTESELLEADNTDKLLCRHVSCDVPPQGELCSELFVT